ncbi:MAG: extracellular solute-binding protein [Propionibacterium sp.]|nr:extracellular solute-binding protein [Propionibacterium sp.]
MNRTQLTRRACMTLATAAAAALALAGCNAAAPSNTTAGGVTNLKLIMNPGPEATAMSKVMAAYNAGQGATDKIHVAVDQLSRTDTYAKEATLMSTKSADYDFYQTASYYIAQHAPYLEPLQLNSSQYFPGALNSLKVNGEQEAIPLDPSVNFVFYRKDLIGKMLTDKAKFEQISQQVLGKKLEPKSPDQWTWDDYIASAAYFTRKYNSASPTQYGTELQAKNLVYNSMLWDDVLWNEGGSWLNSSGKPDLTSAAAKSAVNVYRTIYTKGLTSPASDQAEYPETEAALSSGNAAFALQWNAGYDQLNDPKQSPKTAGKIGIAPVPGVQHLSHVHTLAIGVNKYGQHVAQAQKFIAYLDTVNAMKAYVAAGGLASMPSALTDGSASISALKSTLANGTFNEPALPKAFDIYTALASDLSGAWVGQGSVDSALQKANADLAQLSGK